MGCKYLGFHLQVLFYDYDEDVCLLTSYLSLLLGQPVMVCAAWPGTWDLPLIVAYQ